MDTKILRLQYVDPHSTNCVVNNTLYIIIWTIGAAQKLCLLLFCNLNIFSAVVFKNLRKVVSLLTAKSSKQLKRVEVRVR